MSFFNKLIGKNAGITKEGILLRGLVVYDSKTGNTEKMALAIGQGMQENGVETRVKRVEKASMNDLIESQVIVLGSPTYFANMSTKMKDFIDKTIKIYPDRLADKAGACFTACDGVGGDIAVLNFTQAMLMHRMVIIGPESGGFGIVQVGNTDDRCIADCQAFGNRIGAFTIALEAGKEKIQ
jgi:NAD(P)H dehydrogenase (quinone)